jgi:hypothetical protein
MPWRAVASEQPVLNPPNLGEHTREVLSEVLGDSQTMKMKAGGHDQ